MRKLLCISQEAWGEMLPEAYYSLLFFKCLTLFSVIGLCLLAFVSLVSEAASNTVFQVQIAALLLVSGLHLWARKAVHLAPAAYILIAVFFLALAFLIFNSNSGDASGAYHYIGPLVFIAMFLLGSWPALVLFAVYGLFFLGMAANVFEHWGWFSIPHIVPVRRQVYVDRLIELAILCGGSAAFRAISHAQALALREKVRLTSEKKSLESIRSLAGGIAHEINNPLAIIQAAMDILQRKEWLDPKAEKFVEKIEHATQRIKDFVVCIQTLTRPKTSEKRFFPVHMLIRETLQESARSELVLDNALRKTRIDIPSTLAVYSDYESLSSVIRALQINAAEANAESSEGSIRWTLTSRNDFCHLTCEDTGPDFDAKLLKRFSEPFFTTKFDRPRRGLGLTTSRLLLALNGWELHFERISGCTLVSVLIPLHAVQEINPKDNDRSLAS